MALPLLGRGKPEVSLWDPGSILSLKPLLGTLQWVPPAHPVLYDVSRVVLMNDVSDSLLRTADLWNSGMQFYVFLPCVA